MGVRSTLSRAWPRLTALMLSGLAGMPVALAADGPAAPAGAPSLAACDAGAATVLDPQSPLLAAATPAAPQPVWLDARRLRWPGLVLAAGEVVRWHHSAAGGLTLNDGRISGADRSATLRVVDTAREPLSAETAAQAAYLGAGAEFALEEGAIPQRGSAVRP
ncbi:hypothetical protein ACQ859_12265 [Roseateles chitinivorans]|uniref:hypothetical protein n=1 Tax=Roseateles chitinivorans TaxID=2917965 RepID=UPI003D66BEAE